VDLGINPKCKKDSISEIPKREDVDENYCK
jgi:hypothetical protein